MKVHNKGIRLGTLDGNQSFDYAHAQLKNLNEDIKDQIELRKNKYREYLELFTENAGDILFVFNLIDLQTEYISPSVTKVTGFTVYEALSHRLDELMTAESYEYMIKVNKTRVQRLLLGEFNKKVFVDNLVHYKKDGTTFYSETSQVYTKKKDGTPIIVGVLRDISDRRKLELSLSEKNEELKAALKKIKKTNRELDVANKTKLKLFSILSHDLRNPIQAIVGLTNELNDFNDSEQGEIEEIFKTINGAANRLSRLSNNLLDFTRVHLKNIKPKKEDCNLEEIINETITDLANNANRKDVIIKPQIENGLTQNCDKQMVSTILRNLLNNAIKYSYHGGSIVITAQYINERVEIGVTDFGIKISQVEKEKIFDNTEFFSSPGTNKEKGSGIGLKTAIEFAKLNNGEITLSTRGKSKTFKLTL